MPSPLVKIVRYIMQLVFNKASFLLACGGIFLIILVQIGPALYPEITYKPNEVSESKPTYLTSGWQLQWGDHRDWIDASGNLTAEVEENGEWIFGPVTYNGVGRNGNNFVWYRVRLPAQIIEHATLRIPGIYQHAEFFIGGKLRYRTGDINSAFPRVGGHPPINIVLSQSDGDAVMHVRVYSRFLKAGFMGYPVIDVSRHYQERVDLVEGLRLGVGVLCCMAALVFWMYGIGGKKEEYAPYLVLVTLVTALHTFTRTSLVYNWLDPQIVSAIEITSLMMIPVAVSLYCRRFLSHEIGGLFRNFARVAAGIFIVAIFVWLSTRYEFEDILIPYSFALLSAIMVFAIKAMLDFSRKSIKGAYFYIGLFVFTSLGLIDGLAVCGVLPWLEPLTIYGVAVFVSSCILTTEKALVNTPRIVLEKPESDISPNQNRFTLMFPRVLELEFKRELFLSRMPQEVANNYLASSAWSFLLLYFSLSIYAPSFINVVEEATDPKILALTSLTLIGILSFHRVALRHPEAWKIYDFLLPAGLFIYQGVQIPAFLSLSTESQKAIFVGVMMYVVATMIGHSMRFIIAIFTGMLLSAMWAGIYLYEGSYVTLGGKTFFFFAVVFFVFGLGASIAFTMEKKMRKQFMTRKLYLAEKDNSDRLMLNILPEKIAIRLKGGDATIADYYAEATVLFCDIAGFTKTATVMSAQNLVLMLNSLYSEFDRICQEFGLEKIKTGGDSYMAVAGVPEAQEEHAINTILAAMAMMQSLGKTNTRFDVSLNLRVGINSGPLIGGVIGSTKFSFDVWGDTVNIASRMESTAEIGSIQVSEATFELVRERFEFAEPVEKSMKGKGVMPTYTLLYDKLKQAA